MAGRLFIVALIAAMSLAGAASAQTPRKGSSQPAKKPADIPMPPPPSSTVKKEPVQAPPDQKEVSHAPTAPPPIERTVSTPVEVPKASKAPFLTIMPKVGGAFPQVLNRLNTSAVAALEFGYVTPLLNHQLAVGVEVSYAAPVHSRSIEDPRVPDGSASYTLQERQLGVFVGPRYYIFPLSQAFVPFAGAGVRVQFLESKLDANASSSDFGQHGETGTHVAFGGQLGAGYRVGPGHIALEVQIISSPIDHLVTGKVDIGDLAVRAGYLLHF